MTGGIYLLVFLVMVIASTVQSSVGMGQGLLSAPLLRLIEPDLIPGPIVFVGVLTSIVLAVRNTRRTDVVEVVPAIAGRTVGAGIAVALLAVLSDRGLTLAIGGIVLGLVILRLTGLKIARSARALAGTGIVSGVGGTIAGLGGAPMALLFEQDSEARNFRGPMGAFQAIGGLSSLGLLVIAGEMDADAWLLGALLVPPVMLGWILARWVTPVVDRGFLRPVVLGLSSASALVLIASEVL